MGRPDHEAIGTRHAKTAPPEAPGPISKVPAEVVGAFAHVDHAAAGDGNVHSRPVVLDL